MEIGTDRVMCVTFLVITTMLVTSHKIPTKLFGVFPLVFDK